MENIINLVKDKYKEHSSRKHPQKASVSAASTSIDGEQCKEVAFHHAGYNPDFGNTVMFRLKGSRCYGGGVRGSAVCMILFILLGEEVAKTVRVSVERGKTLFAIYSDTVFSDRAYYIHCTLPGNPSDHLYQFPLAPSFKVWSIPDSVPVLWTRDSNKSLVDTRNSLEMHNPTGLDLRVLCNKSVIARDKYCVLSGAKAADCERAFIIPIGEDTFWKTETMSSHLGDKSFWWKTTKVSRETRDRMFAWDIFHPLNRITLRKDLRRAYHDGAFVFLPTGDYWVTHFFDPTSTLGKEFDQKPIKLSQEIPKLFLLVRLAIAAFTLAEKFVEQGECASSTS